MDLDRYFAWRAVLIKYEQGLMPKHEAAKLLGVDRSTISNWCNSEKVSLESIRLPIPGDEPMREYVPTCQVLSLFDYMHSQIQSGDSPTAVGNIPRFDKQETLDAADVSE